MYLTVHQTAERLHVSDKTVYRRMWDGTLPFHRLGVKTIRIDEKELAEIMEQNKSAS